MRRKFVLRLIFIFSLILQINKSTTFQFLWLLSLLTTTQEKGALRILILLFNYVKSLISRQKNIKTKLYPPSLIPPDISFYHPDKIDSWFQKELTSGLYSRYEHRTSLRPVHQNHEHP